MRNRVPWLVAVASTLAACGDGPPEVLAVMAIPLEDDGLPFAVYCRYVDGVLDPVTRDVTDECPPRQEEFQARRPDNLGFWMAVLLDEPLDLDGLGDGRV